MDNPPLGSSRSRLLAAWTLGDINLGPTDLAVDFPDEVPGLPGDQGVLHGHPPVREPLETVLRGVLNGISQRNADLAVGVDGVGNDLAAVCGQVYWGAITSQFLRWGESDAITRAVTLAEGQAKPELHGFVSREVASIESADILRTHLLTRDRAGCARRCRRVVGFLGGSGCHPREPEDHS